MIDCGLKLENFLTDVWSYFHHVSVFELFMFLFQAMFMLSRKEVNSVWY